LPRSPDVCLLFFLKIIPAHVSSPKLTTLLGAGLKLIIGQVVPLMRNLCVSDSRRCRGIFALNKFSRDCDLGDLKWPTPNVAANMIGELSLPQIGSARTDGGAHQALAEEQKILTQGQGIRPPMLESFPDEVFGTHNSRNPHFSSSTLQAVSIPQYRIPFHKDAFRFSSFNSGRNWSGYDA
jgi:hypothetical protein